MAGIMIWAPPPPRRGQHREAQTSQAQIGLPGHPGLAMLGSVVSTTYLQ